MPKITITITLTDDELVYLNEQADKCDQEVSSYISDVVQESLDYPVEDDSCFTVAID